jgi:very-short-patch-repair endonuclease
MRCWSRRGGGLAAALAVPGAALGHRTAAALWRLEVGAHAIPELTCTREARSRPGLVVHRSRTLAAEDLIRWHGVAVTRIERTRSELQRAFVRMARRNALGRPQCNVWVAGLLVDAFWPEHRLVVECDSQRWHASWRARRHDHARDAKLQLAGFSVVRVTCTEVRRGPELGAARVRAFL